MSQSARRRARLIPRLALCAALLAFVVAAPGFACIWDSDTLAQEAEGELDAVRAIVGFFPRNPPIYYEMRLARAAKDIVGNADNLAAYDDAGASCDRLGRGDEAIAWMEKKLERLDALKAAGREDAEHRYRYLANVGTFWAHRWFAQGQDRERIEEMRTAAAFIREAIALNPDAHFGREKYQLMAMEWIVDPPPALDTYGNLSKVPSLLGLNERGHPVSNSPINSPTALEDAIEGLVGLVALGNAWESPDVFQSLAISLQATNASSVALLAQLRYQELILAGKRSAWPLAKDEIVVGDGAPRPPVVLAWSKARERDAIQAKYNELRAFADAAHETRIAYMIPRLEAGRHPDTHPDFWDDYDEPMLPSMVPSQWESLMVWHNDKGGVAPVVEFLLAILGGILGTSYIIFRYRRNRRPAISPPETRS
jgi:hypothetical protein